MKRRSFWILTLIFTALTAQAQWLREPFADGTFGLRNLPLFVPYYRPGFVVLNNNDTLRGRVNTKRFHTQVKFKKIGERKIKKYYPTDLKGLRWDTERFVTKNVPGENGKCFLRIVTEGYVTCYEFRYLAYTQPNSTGTIHSALYLKKENNDLVFHPSRITERNARADLNAYLRDDSVVCKNIEDDRYGSVSSSSSFFRVRVTDHLYKMINDYNVRKYKPAVPKTKRTGNVIFYKELNKEFSGLFLTVNDSIRYPMDRTNLCTIAIPVDSPSKVCYGTESNKACVLISALPVTPIYCELSGDKYEISIEQRNSRVAHRGIAYTRLR
jgi:hypothetical protein